LGVQKDPNPVRILLAEEQSLFREAVRVVLEHQPDLIVVGETGQGMQATVLAEREQPDVALIDAGLPDADGIRTTAAIIARAPNCRVVLLTECDDESVLIGALEAGAAGFLAKSAPLSDLIDATRRAHKGEVLIPPSLLAPLLSRLVRRRREQNDALRQVRKLTRREREILALLTGGADNDGIAQALVISPGTARTHVQNVLSKLGVHSRLEAAAFVLRNGIAEELQESML